MRLQNLDSSISVMREVAVGMLSACQSILTKTGQDVFDEAEKLVIRIVETYAKLSDSELRRESKHQKRQIKQIVSIDEKTDAEDAFEYLKLMKHLFTDQEWDEIVETKTRLYEKAHVKQGEV